MRIVDTWYLFPLRDAQAGENGIEIDGADGIHFLKQQVKEQPDIIFGIEPSGPVEPATDPFLPELHRGQRERGRKLSPYQGNGIAVLCQACADPLHSLVIAEVIGDGKINSLQNMANKQKEKGFANMQNLNLLNDLNFLLLIIDPCSYFLFHYPDSCCSCV